MNNTLELTMSLIDRAHSLNLKFTHELMKDVTAEGFEEFKMCYYELLNKKWLEYAEKN